MECFLRANRLACCGSDKYQIACWTGYFQLCTTEYQVCRSTIFPYSIEGNISGNRIRVVYIIRCTSGTSSTPMVKHFAGRRSKRTTRQTITAVICFLYRTHRPTSAVAIEGDSVVIYYPLCIKSRIGSNNIRAEVPFIGASFFFIPSIQMFARGGRRSTWRASLPILYNHLTTWCITSLTIQVE